MYFFITECARKLVILVNYYKSVTVSTRKFRATIINKNKLNVCNNAFKQSEHFNTLATENHILKLSTHHYYKTWI